MKIVIDKHIPFLEGLFEPFAEVRYLDAVDITHSELTHADCLIVRTRTRCNEALLSCTRVKMVASATSGYEHIDMDYCRRSGIKAYVAHGCNASSVCQYVGSVLALWAREQRVDLRGKTLGIVGYGHVGHEVEKLANLLGMRVLLNDPPKEKEGYPSEFVGLQSIAEQSDFITFHTSLQKDGEFPSYHLADMDFFQRCGRKPLIINAARGGVVCEKSIQEAYRKGLVAGFAVDCWEGEPKIWAELLEWAFVTTPHIAGYSADSKANGSVMCAEAVCDFFGFQPRKELSPLSPKRVFEAKDSAEVARILLETYDVERDSDMLRQAPHEFEKQRNSYHKLHDRREVEIYLKQIN